MNLQATGVPTSLPRVGGACIIALRSGRMVLVLPAGVLFEAGKAEVGTKGRSALIEMATVRRAIFAKS